MTEFKEYVDKKLERAKKIRAIYYTQGRIIDRARLMVEKLGFKCGFYYTPVDESKIQLFSHELYKVKRFFDRCKKHLGLPGLWIEWVEDDNEKNYRIFGGIKRDVPIMGQADVGNSDKISIRGDVPYDEVLRTIAHEAHHHWFYKKWGGKPDYWHDDEMREGTAESFAGKMLYEFEVEEIERKRRASEVALPFLKPGDWN